MSNKHPPSPWRYLPNLQCDSYEQTRDSYAFPYLIYAGAEFIAQVATDQLCELSRDEEHARLIAAAPDLLAACEGALNALNGDDVSETPVQYLAAALDLTHAINKAKGETSC